MFTTGVTEDGRVFIQDEEGDSDARLYVNGNFASKDAERAYAQIISSALGAHRSSDIKSLETVGFNDEIMIDLLLNRVEHMERQLWFAKLNLKWERDLRMRWNKGEDEIPARWYPIADAPVTPTYTNPAYDFAPYLHGPMVQLLIDLGVNVNGDGGEEPRFLVTVGWWSPEHSCWRHCDDDGPNDLQPVAWCPLESAPTERFGGTA